MKFEYKQNVLDMWQCQKRTEKKIKETTTTTTTTTDNWMQIKFNIVSQKKKIHTSS